MGAATQPQMNAAQANGLATQMVTARALRMVQQVFSNTYTPSSQNVVNIIPRNVGLIMGFWLKVVSTISNTTGGSVAITPTNFGAANLLSQIQFTDLNNLVRIQTSGRHMNLLNTVKARAPYGSALVNSSMDGLNVSGAYGANWTVINEPSSIADSNSGTVTMWYYVPLAYGDGDYRGAVFANVVNATMQLQVTINTTPVVAATADSTNAVYVAAGGAGANTSTTITVYQDYLDQLPVGSDGRSFVLPMLSLSTIYEIKETIFTSIVQGNDFPMQYPNFRDFLSTFAIYNNNGTTGRGVGADINYWTLQAANLTNIFKLEPSLVALRSRALIHTDFPKGAYYFGSRQRPISTTQYGNMELVLNASSASAGAYVLVGWEDFGLQNVITQAGSLPAS